MVPDRQGLEVVCRLDEGALLLLLSCLLNKKARVARLCTRAVGRMSPVCHEERYCVALMHGERV